MKTLVAAALIAIAPAIAMAQTDSKPAQKAAPKTAAKAPAAKKTTKKADAADTADPTFYDALVPASVRITLGAGEKKVQELRLAGPRWGAGNAAMRQ